jgi:hypothetical protein
LYVDVDNCSALQGGLIMEDENFVGEHTLKRGKDVYNKCRWIVGIDGLRNLEVFEWYKKTAIVT